jgi:hypothetical protein
MVQPEQINMQKMFYYELYDHELKTNTYYARRAKHSHLQNIEYGPLDLTLRANRIWLEEDTEVKFIKNRNNPKDYPVDLKEFMWIKLQAEAA